MDRFKIISKNELANLPKTSGVYSFISKNDTIYIGKAINIQNRVKNHFNQPSYRDNLFINQVEKVGFFETNSEIEALILEANLIKKYQPKYNVVWRDDKNYFYVAIANPPTGGEQKIPYVFLTHQPHSLSLRENPQVDEAIQSGGTNSRLLRRSAPRNDGTKYIGPFVEGTALKKTLRFLRRVFPYYTTKKHPKNKCTYCHLDLCPGPNPDLVEYKNNIKKLVLILRGKRSAVLNSLKKEMKQFSKENKFEEAGKIRDRIYNLQQVMSHTHVINDASLLEGPTLQQLGGSDPQMALAKIIGSEKPVTKIECYDISNIQGKQATGSMVVFSNGVPDKSQYKKFKIRMKNEPNDIAMLKEVLQRRFSHEEWPYPEVILIDGGKAQLNVAVGVIARSVATKQSRVRARTPGLPRSPAGSLAMTKMTELKKIKVMSIAKRNRDLYIEGRNKPVLLKTLPREIYNLILQLDDEAHRFAITYHKKLRKKNLLK